MERRRKMKKGDYIFWRFKRNGGGQWNSGQVVELPADGLVTISTQIGEMILSINEIEWKEWRPPKSGASAGF
jgi:hypothetical protein